MFVCMYIYTCTRTHISIYICTQTYIHKYMSYNIYNLVQYIYTHIYTHI